MSGHADSLHGMHIAQRSVPQYKLFVSVPLQRSHRLISLAYGLFNVIYGVLFIVCDQHPSRNDEKAHWLRAMQIMSGHPRSVADPGSASRFGGIGQDGVFTDFSNTAVYSPLVYFPSLFSGGDYRTACIFTLLFCTVITSVAILLCGGMGPLMAVSAMLPTVFLSYSFPSADSITTAIAFLFIGAVFYCRDNPSPGALAMLTFISVALGCTKSTNTALLLLLPLVIKRNSPFKSWNWMSVFIPLLAAVVPALLWQHAIRAIAPGTKTISEMRDTEFRIVSEPWRFLQSIGRTLINPLDKSQEGVENVTRNIELLTGSQYTILPLTVMAPILLAYVLVAIYAINRIRLSYAGNAIVLCSLAAFYVLTCAAMLVTWKGDVGGYAEGMQSRYFVPCLPILPLIFHNSFTLEYTKKYFQIVCASLILITYIGMFFAHALNS